MDMEILLKDGKKVEAHYKGFTINTDQPEITGGDNTAPTPFDLFIASIGTCVGIFTLSFCRQRSIETKDIKINLDIEKNENKMIRNINIKIFLPKYFPEKYRTTIINVAEQCSVKKHLDNPPSFNITSEYLK